MEAFTHNDVVIETTEQLYKGFFKMARFTLQHRLFEGGWTETVSRECFMQGEAVAVILYDPDNDSVLLGEQFRIGTLRENSPWLLEPVAGRIEAGETPDAVARRESAEEMNATIKKLIPIFDFYSSPGASDEKVYYYCGIVDSQGMKRICGLKAENEDISVDVYAFEDVIQMLDNNKLKDGITIIGIQWLQIHRQRLQSMR